MRNFGQTVAACLLGLTGDFEGKQGRQAGSSCRIGRWSRVPVCHCSQSAPEHQNEIPNSMTFWSLKSTRRQGECHLSE